MADMQGKRVMLVGCGSVGGYIAYELVRAGIVDLTLVDGDRLSEENIFRHVLGRKSIGHPKAAALKSDIAERLPYVKVTAVEQKAEVAIADRETNLHSYDLIVVAIGNPTSELFLNKLAKENVPGPAIVFTWVEPYGIGGHAILVNKHAGQPGGCLQCLYTPLASNSEAQFENRASFAAGGQEFAKNFAGCASRFIPYSSLDALRTAELATRLAVTYLSGEVEGSPILSWKGPPSSFIGNGYLLSPRYDFTDRQLYDQRFDYRNPDCAVCGKV